MVVVAVCIVPGCNRTAINRERCQACYTYLRSHGHDRPLELIEKQQRRDFNRIDLPVVVNKAQAQLVARMARRRLLAETPDETEPVEPVLEMLGLIQRSAANVRFYEQRVQELQADGHQIYVDMRGISTRGDIFETGEARPHVIVTMYDAERDRHAKLTSEAIKLGLEERRVRLAERDAIELADAYSKSLDDAGLSPEQKERMRRAFIGRLGRDADSIGQVSSA